MPALARRRYRVLLALVLVAVAIRAVLPAILRRVVVTQADEAVIGRIEIDDVDLSLLTGGFTLHGLRVFSAEAVARLLATNPRMKLLSSIEVVDRVVAIAPNLARQTVGSLPNPGQSIGGDVGGVPVRVLRIRHNRARRLPCRFGNERTNIATRNSVAGIRRGR